MCWGFVPAGATGSILTNIDVIHEPIAIQETLPCERKQSVVRRKENLQLYDIQLIRNSIFYYKLKAATEIM